MKFLVVVPPIKDFYFTYHRASFIGAHITNKILKDLGFDTELIIFPLVKKKPKKIDLPKELSYLNHFIHYDEHGPISFFTGYKTFGPDIKECAQMVVSKKSKVIFISCFAFCYAQETIDLAEEIKRTDPKTKVVAGGSGVCVFPEFFKSHNSIDDVIPLEAEEGIPLFFDKKPYTSLIPMIAKTIKTKRHIFYSTYLSRGCPKGCEFCSVNLVHGKRMRFVDEKSFLKQISYLLEKKIFLNFEDDNILFNERFFVKILKKIVSIRKNILFLCENGIDYMQLDTTKLDILIKLGFQRFNFSLGNIDPQISISQKRKNDLNKLKEFLNFLHHNNIPSITYFISGFKKETKQIALKNLIVLSQLNTLVGFSPFYPVPGIKNFENRDIFKRFSPRLACGSSLWPWNNSLTTQEMVTLFRLVRIVNLYKKKSKTPEEEELLKKCFREKKLFTFQKKEHCLKEVKNYDKTMVKDFFDAFKLK